MTNLSTGATALRTAGSRWRMPPKGTKVNITDPGKRTGRSVCLQADRKGDVMPGDAFGALRWALAELVTA